jgi:hypothetical protein
MTWPYTTTTNNMLLDEQTRYSQMYITLAGEADFDEYVYNKLESGELTADQATYLWDYTDGYKMTITSTINYASTDTDINSIHCLQKSWSAITQADYNNGAVCFEATRGALTLMSYYGGITEGTTMLENTDVGNKW